VLLQLEHRGKQLPTYLALGGGIFCSPGVSSESRGIAQFDYSLLMHGCLVSFECVFNLQCIETRNAYF
jgi:hypothetical protein